MNILVAAMELTCKSEPYPTYNAEFHAKDVEYEMPMVIVRDTIVHPWTMAVQVSTLPLPSYIEYLLVTLCNTPFAPLAVFAPEGLPNHAVYTEMMLVKMS